MLGSSSGQLPDLWEKLIEDTFYYYKETSRDNVAAGSGLSRDKMLEDLIQRWSILDGTYQGFTVFSDSSLHKILWRYVVRVLLDEKKLSGLSMTHVFMDDLLILFVMDSVLLENQDHSRACIRVADARKKMSKVFEESFGMKIGSSLWSDNGPGFRELLWVAAYWVVFF